MATYTITYNLNSGSGSFPAQSANEGTYITLNSATPTRTNYTFVRWDSSTGTIYSPGSTFTENNSVTLTAAWTSTPSGFVPVSNVQINSKPSTLNMTKGQTATYTCTVLPSNATDQSVIWTPRNNINYVINTLGSGTGNKTVTITATGGGTATLSVRSNANNNRYDSFNINVPYEYVDVPQDDRQLGTSILYMGWHTITSTTSTQYKMRENARATGRYQIANPEYYGLIDGRISIATKSNIGNILPVVVGDYVDVTLKKSGGGTTIYNCIIGDIKGNDAPNPWGHNDGKNVVEVIYHDYNPPAGYNKNTNNLWGAGNVLKITKTGNYFYK